FFGPLTLTSGRVNLNASGAASTGNILLSNLSAIGSTAIPNSVIDLANPITFTNGGDISSNAGVTLNVTGKLSGGAPAGWTHGAPGNGTGTLVLSNTTNDFAGTLTIQSGLVVVTADHVLGVPGLSTPLQAGSNTVLTGAGQIAFQSANNMTYSTAEQIIIQSSATAGATQINNIQGDNTFAGGVQFNQGTLNTIGVDAGTLTLSGQVIAAPPDPKPFAKVGPGTLIVTAENTTGF